MNKKPFLKHTSPKSRVYFFIDKQKNKYLKIYTGSKTSLKLDPNTPNAEWFSIKEYAWEDTLQVAHPRCIEHSKCTSYIRFSSLITGTEYLMRIDVFMDYVKENTLTNGLIKSVFAFTNDGRIYPTHYLD